MEKFSVRLISPLAGVRDFKITGENLPLPENIVWTEQAFPRVLRATKMAATVSSSHRTIQLSELGNFHTLQQAKEFVVLWPASMSTHRLIAETREESPSINAIVLPLDGAFETRLDAARRFRRALSGRSLGSRFGALPDQTKIRHILNLRAHDGRRTGATYRQIAEVLLSREPIAPRDWRDHHLRHKIRAILGRADRLVAGGYRDLLFYPHRRGRTSDC
ncbi:DUF2285 domain-containing protein [Mesorhizobium sp.]|uniref:DUF2285 domain-containing protein n=1 Tax=Mesorhizobium sp. TaxID=1871066 RepID=UPI0011FF30C2|nr:DUF2285 domain-containing protein [Mesorhizobium sp.]TIT03297.1 MAG: DUF2285 domain-containing protein [Mesorhizobium sp.]